MRPATGACVGSIVSCANPLCESVPRESGRRADGSQGDLVRRGMILRMKHPICRIAAAVLIAFLAALELVHAQQQSGLSAADKTRRWDLENELQQIAIVDRKVMMAMPDGVRLATDIYRPKNASGK